MTDIFDTQPTCGEISCDQCNERYEKAMERIAALEDVVREYKDRHFCGEYTPAYCFVNNCKTCRKATAILNEGK